MGRSKKLWYEKARLMLWSREVLRHKSKKSIAALNEEFAYKEPLTKVERLSMRKIFQGFRDRGYMPRGGDPKLRTLEEIIQAVEACPEFTHTVAFYNSKLWELLRLESISEAEILKRIDDLFAKYGLQRRPIPNFVDYRSGRNPALDYLCPINPLELLDLQRANLPTIETNYWSLLIFLHFRTSIVGRSERMFDNASCSLISTFERELGDAAQEFTPHLLKWIDEIEVIRVF